MEVEALDFKINTKFIDEFSKEVYEQTYRYGTENINQTQLRVAKDLASIEDDKDYWTKKFLWALEDFKFSPGGRITSNAGTGLKGTTYINCFTPEVEVLTKNGYTPIKDIKVNDFVLTHKGKWEKVKSTMKKEFEGELDVYVSSVLSSTIKSTPDHPFYQGNNQWEISKNNEKLVLLKYESNKTIIEIDIFDFVKDINRIDGKSVGLFYDDNIIHTTSSHEFYNGSVITKESKSINRKIKIDENISYAFGRFVGDGSTFNVNNNYEVDGFNIIFSKKERSELLFIKESMENSFGIDININESKDFDGVYIRKNNPVLAKFFCEAFGRGSNTKKIPSFIWDAPKNIMRSFLLGIFDADGTITKKQELRITLSNYKLVKDIQALMNMIGYPGRITETSSGKFKSWKLFINRIIGYDFIGDMKKHYNDDRILDIQRGNKIDLVLNGLSPISDVSSNYEKIHTINNFIKSKEYYKGYVYNISVSNDESYVVNNVIVHNCFVDGFMGEDQDSMEGILDALRRQALILKSEGGYGFCADVMRPRGSFIHGIGNESPGSVRMLDMWDMQSGVITEGSGSKTKNEKGKVKIRKGAQMVTMSCWHPDIEEYITAKQTPGRLTKFNMSVLVTDEFMEAVKNNQPWNLEFPDYNLHSKEYKKNWDGNIKKWKSLGYTTTINKTYTDANELWDIIMTSTYTKNEPGVLFVDTMNRLNNLSYCEYITATNPSLRAGTKVLTKNGIFDIESLENQEFYTKNLNGEWSLSKCFLSGKDKNLYKLTLSNGREIYATAEHKWPTKLVGGGWGKVTTDKLVSGNILPFPESVGCLEINGDESLTRDEGFMVGWLYGDGWISQRKDNKKTTYGFLFNQEEQYLSDVILKEVNKLKSTISNLTPSASLTNIQISSSIFDEITKKRYGIFHKNKLPSVLWQSNDNFIKGFIDGLISSDGSCSKNLSNKRITLTNKYKDIVEDISALLSFYGIKTSICHHISKNNTFPNGKKYNKEYTRYDLTIEGDAIRKFSKSFTISNKNKQERIDILSKIEKTRKVPDEGVIRIKSVEKTNIFEDVWDISVFDDTHCFHINHCVTGNCGEQILPIGGVCLLGSINLTQFIDFEKRNWDFNKLKKLIPIAIRFMDNVNDKTNVPLPSQRESLKSKRRIGLGILGYGSALMMLKMKYGSKEALDITEKLMRFIANQSYQSSALLAKEKGSFPLFEKDNYLNSAFIKQALDIETVDMIRKYGLRNSHLLSIQPTGNSSVFANNVSGGLEPLFMPKYVRTTIMPYAPDGLDRPRNIDWANKTFESDSIWLWIKEGDENLLKTDFDGYVWKFDKSRGLLRENIVKDYAVRFLEDKGQWDENADWAATTTELTIKEHINTMSIMSRYIDSAMSKCIVEGTLITTDKGIIPIESLSNNIIENSFNDTNDEYKILDENGEIKNISSHYFGGEKDCYNIKFSNGFNLESAFTHKLKTEDGWKSVLDLKAGDNVYFRTNNIENKRDYVPIESKPDFFNCIKLNIPSLLDENYAKFIGMLLSDGSINRNSIGIVEKNKKVGYEIDRLFNILFGINPKISIDKRSGVKYHYLNSRALVIFYKKLIGNNALNKDIPKEILISNDSVKKSFLSGLSLDGYIKEDGNLVIYEGYSKNIQIKTSYILSSLGYDYYLGKKNVTAGRLSKTSYMVKGYLTDKFVEPIEDHKYEYITEGRKQKQVFVNNKEIYNDLPKSNEENYFMFRNLRKSLKSSSFTRKESLDSLGIEYDNNLTCISIKSINYIGKKKVYDIEVEDTHSYLINGVVSHNTINLPNEYSFENFKGLYMDMYNTGTIKGGTTYRAGTMTTVLSKDSTNDDYEFHYHNAPKRPKELECDVFKITAKAKKWTVIVGLYTGNPYECFAIEHDVTEIPENFKKGFLVKEGRGTYTLKNEKYTINDVTSGMTDEEESLTRMISTALRHGSSIDFIVDQLNKSNGTVVSFNKAISRVLSKYAKEINLSKKKCESCGSANISFEEGCFKCYDCSSSKCGS